MAAILEVSGLKKTYKNFELKNVSFSIHEDCITGFIGVNGAGKTTTINALLNLLLPTQNGTITPTHNIWKDFLCNRSRQSEHCLRE